MTTAELQKIVAHIRDVFQLPNEFIPLHQPFFTGLEKQYVNDAIDSTFVSSVGKYVDEFEKQIAKICDTEYAVATVNGTSALHIALKLAGVESNTEVITQAFTFVATANAISYLGAHPNFVDIDKESLGICPDKLSIYFKDIIELKEGIPFNKRTGKRISCCVPMHTFGFASKIEEIISVCNQYNIPVVEDAAECLGSKVNEKSLGSFGLMGTLSFNGNKIVTSGGGGAIVTNDKALAAKAKHITTTAKQPHAWKYFHDETGYNYRMPNLNAAFICAQLQSLNQFIENKRELAHNYATFFKTLNIEFVTERPFTKANYWLNTLVLKNKEDRDLFLEYTNANGVMTRPGWELMHNLPMFNQSEKDDLSVSEELQNRIVNIPSSVRG